MRLAIAALCVGTLGCGAAMDANSGGDHVRGKAAKIKLNETHDDSVSTEEGDHTDWKKLALPESCKLSVHAYWDDPSVKSIIHVRDQFGGQIFELKHEVGQAEDHWKDMKMREGEYYFEVVAERGSSVYTLEVTTSDGGGDTGDPGLAPPE